MPRGKAIDVAWLREHYPTMSDVEMLLDDYEHDFGWRPSKTAVYVKANRLGIRKRPVEGRGNRCERPVYWSKEPEMEAWMLEHDHGERSDVLSALFRERFGFGLSRPQIDGFRASHGTGCRRRPGHGGGRQRVPVGTERRGKDGYTVVKVAEEATVPMSKDNWKLKHVWVWEQAHGTDLPKDQVVMFADKDRENFDPSNLVAVPRRLVGVINALGVPYHDAETLAAVVAMAELRVARNNAIASIRRVCPCCGRSFDNLSRRNAGGSVVSTVCPECGAKGKKPPAKVLGSRRRFDHDKIRALHSQGLRNEQIADIIGCTPSTVSAVIHRTSEKRREERLKK